MSVMAKARPQSSGSPDPKKPERTGIALNTQIDTENIRKANKRRASHICRNCGGHAAKVDGSKCGGVPGVTYWQCDVCGHARAITKRQRKFKF